MLFFLAFNSHFYLFIIKIAIYTINAIQQNTKRINISHKLFSVAYFHCISFCPSLELEYLHFFSYNIIFNSSIQFCSVVYCSAEIETHIIVKEINNIMRPYGTQLCSVLTRICISNYTYNKRKKMFKIYEVRFNIEIIK